MRKDFFTFTPQFKLIIAGNHKPTLRCVDEAIRRRFHLIPFNTTIPEDERDPDLTEKLRQEWPGILACAIEGCREWQRVGLAPPPAVRDATTAYLEGEDGLSLWMEECCEFGGDKWASSTALFASWDAWCKRSGEHAGSKKTFVQTLESRGFARERRPHARGFRGLRVASADSSDSYYWARDR
jgi:putative DNA primase/helicase